jgi:hypothetical protein
MPPVPVSKSFLVCRRIFLDAYTNETIILGPTHEIVAPSYPLVANLSIFGRWTSVHGVYELDIQLQDLQGHVIWGERQERLLECHNPLLVTVVTLQPLNVFFPKPGKYEMVILANGQEVVRDVFWAHLPAPPAAESPPDTA